MTFMAGANLASLLGGQQTPVLKIIARRALAACAQALKAQTIVQ